MRETITDRSRALFQEALVTTIAGINRVKVQQAAKGMLASGNTVSQFVDVHEAVTRDTITQIVDSIARRVESRGFRWRRSIRDVRRELEAYFANADTVLNQELTKVLINGATLAEPLLRPARERLYRHLSDYEQGWTGAPGRSWIERHKIIYTILVALGSAALTVAIGIASKLIEAALNAPNISPP